VPTETLDSTRDADARERGPRPGLVVVFSADTPQLLAIPFDGRVLAFGRGSGAALKLPDQRLSRAHTEISYEPGRGWTVRDLGSRNGTFVDGQPLRGERTVSALRVVRMAETLVVPCPDTGAIDPMALGARGVVSGAGLRASLAAMGRAASASITALVCGESGTGKELAARVFHERGPHAKGPFVAVNCAAIPEGLAERLLFGTKRGAYSGASADAQGHVQAADGGVLFLDEGGELEVGVQAKLLRVLETREVVPLGASHGQTVDLRVCVATHRDLRRAVAEGRFRADLYHRIAPPEIVLPPLRERLDEITLHVVDEIAAVSPELRAHPKLVEACLLRHWPGNVRELRKQVRDAALRADAEPSGRVRPEYLSPTAGLPFEALPSPPAPTQPQPFAPGRGYVRWGDAVTREQIERALAEHGGNVADAARALGMQRTQMYREMERWSIPRPKRG
jgi:transcriptional regulator with GAF, ATPase, and Fis domain